MLAGLLKLYRGTPHFKGKLRMGRWLFKDFINQKSPVSFSAHDQVRYSIPNTLENLGIELLINGVYENDIINFLKKQVKDGAIFLDVGANIGSIGLPIIKQHTNIIYYGFEASPKVFTYLNKNFIDNQVKSYELFNCLVYKDDDKSMRFFESELYGKSSLAPTYAYESIEVKSLSLDSFCMKNSIPRIDWLKVDVQGFELYVFEGMKTLLKQKKIENILFEFEAWADQQAGLEEGAAQRYLCTQGYELFGLDGLPLSVSNKKNETMIWARPKINR